MSRMGMSIAMAKRRGPKQRPFPPPADHVTRDESGRICPTCLAFGRSECAVHSSEPPQENTSGGDGE